jgi:Flp pilus assembly pilin Flp
MLHLIVALQSLTGRIADRHEEDRGAAVVEYGLMIAFVVIALSVVLFALQEPIEGFFDRIAGAIDGLRP